MPEAFDFNTLFREQLGWDNHPAQLDIPVDGDTMHLTAVAQKRGFVAYVCPTIPDRSVRLKIDTRSPRSPMNTSSSTPTARRPAGLAVGPPRTGQADGQPRSRFDVEPDRRTLIHDSTRSLSSMDEEENLTLA